MCPYCDRRIGARKDGFRKKHYINRTMGLGNGYRLHECRGSSPQGKVPDPHTKNIANKRRSGRMKCLACESWEKFTKQFLPAKHPDRHGKDCAGWRDNQNR